MVRLTAVAIFLGATTALACQGCGCRGGPGYRGPDGKWVGWVNIGRVCGSPPTTHCTPEGTNAGADNAYETPLGELKQQFEVKAAKVREEYLAAGLEIHAPETNGSQHAHPS